MAKDSKKKWTKDLFKGPKWLKYLKGVLLTAVIVIIVIYGTKLVNSLIHYLTPQKGEFITEVKSSISKIEEISDLTTMSYPYSGVATVNVKDSDKVDYYVCYTGEVTASIDFDEIGIENDPEDEKTVIVEVPEAKIVCNFDSLGSFKFLDVNKGKPLENEIATFTPICKKHMDDQVGKDKTLRKLVQQQASETLQALITPLTEQMNPDYRVVFVDKSQKEAENAAKKEREQTSSKTEVSKSDKETSNEKK